MSFKVDFHTHSVASPDGALTPNHYRSMLSRGLLDCIAITDHNTIDVAVQLHQELDAKIIIGEEITTQAGEIIGLYLTEVVPPMLTIAETVQRIHAQGGLVYIPHPFETVRKGINLMDLDTIVANVDAIEIYNGRAVFQNRSAYAQAWSVKHTIPGAAGSDSHGRIGWGNTYTILAELPNRENFVGLLKNAQYRHKLSGVRGVLYPKFNRLRKKWSHHA